MLKWMSSDELPVMEAGIEFFVFLLKQTAYNRSNSDLPLHRLAPLLLGNLFQIFAVNELSEESREKLMFLVLQLIKTFSIYDGVEDSIVKECFDGTYDIWLSLFVSSLQSSLTTNIGIKKYIMKVKPSLKLDHRRNFQRYAKVHFREASRSTCAALRNLVILL